MREIKFRAWDSKAKAMFPVHDMNFCKTNNQLNSIYGVDIYDKDSDYYGDVSYGGSVHKKTGKPGEPLRPKFELMQYTGLKDKNGVEIYEGDILAFEDDKFVWSVEYEVCCFVANGGEYNQKEELIEFYDWKEESLDVVIIGNIYEHPHLLENNQ